MGQASANIRAMLQERLAGAQAEVALLIAVIDFVDNIEGKPKSGAKDFAARKGDKYNKRCTKCHEIHSVAANKRHCPSCRATNSLKIHDG